MKALYPGSFNPWHKGHENIIKKAIPIFDKLIIAQYNSSSLIEFKHPKIEIIKFDYFITKLIEKIKPDVIIRGLRNGNDLQYELNLQYWYQDLGVKIPIIYFLADRDCLHISSSMIRELSEVNLKNESI